MVANNRVWIFCRNCGPGTPTPDVAEEDRRFIVAKHFYNGWQTRDHFPDLTDWLAKHEDHFFDRTGEEGWDHQFVIVYEDDLHGTWPTFPFEEKVAP